MICTRRCRWRTAGCLCLLSCMNVGTQHCPGTRRRALLRGAGRRTCRAGGERRFRRCEKSLRRRSLIQSQTARWLIDRPTDRRASFRRRLSPPADEGILQFVEFRRMLAKDMAENRLDALDLCGSSMLQYHGVMRIRSGGGCPRGNANAVSCP
jgi:hypothetical protein